MSILWFSEVIGYFSEYSEVFGVTVKILFFSLDEDAEIEVEATFKDINKEKSQLQRLLLLFFGYSDIFLNKKMK